MRTLNKLFVFSFVCLFAITSHISSSYAHTIFDDIGKAAKKVSHDVSKTAKKVVHDAENAAVHGVDPVKKAQQDVTSDAEKELSKHVQSLAASLSQSDYSGRCEKWAEGQMPPRPALFKTEGLLQVSSCAAGYTSGYYCGGFGYLDGLLHLLGDGSQMAIQIAEAASAASKKAPCNKETVSNQLACGLINGVLNVAKNDLKCAEAVTEGTFNDVKQGIELALQGKTGSDRQNAGNTLIVPFCRTSGQLVFATEVDALISEIGVGELEFPEALKEFAKGTYDAYRAYKAFSTIDATGRVVSSYSQKGGFCPKIK